MRENGGINRLEDFKVTKTAPGEDGKVGYWTAKKKNLMRQFPKDGIVRVDSG